MNEPHERRLRRKALRGYLQGLRPAVILRRVGRSREWLSKWRRRFSRAGPKGLHSQLRRPHHRPTAYGSWVRQRVGLIGAAAIRQGERSSARVVAIMRRVIAKAPDARVDYLAAVDALTLEPKASLTGRIVLLEAVRLGRTRLIDNRVVPVS